MNSKLAVQYHSEKISALLALASKNRKNMNFYERVLRYLLTSNSIGSNLDSKLTLSLLIGKTIIQ